MKIKGKFGTITICIPDTPPTTADEERLYNVLVECLLVKPKKNDIPNINKKALKSKAGICI